MNKKDKTLKIRDYIIKEKYRPNASINDLINDRNGWEEFAKSIKLPDSISISSERIDGINTEWISSNRCSTDSLIVHYHGGGYESGSCITHRELASRIVLATDTTVVLVDYRLSPEHPYPCALQDCVRVYRHIVQNITLPHNVVLCGDSAGGGLVMSTLLTIKEDALPMPRSAVVMSPFVDMTLSGESYETRRQVEPQLIKQNLEATVARYIGSTDPYDPMVSPVYGDLSGISPLMIQVGNDEILLSDATTLANNAKKYGVDVELQIWENMWHVFQAYPVVEADRAIESIARFIKKN